MVVSPALDTVFIAGSALFVAVARDADGDLVSNAVFTWQTANGAVASVNSSGQVNGLSAGTTTVSATAAGIVGQATLVVIADPVASVTVTPVSDSVPVGSAIQLQAVARDNNNVILTGLYPTWTSGNPSFATVSPGGLVTGVGNGTATITAAYGAHTGNAQLKVRAGFSRPDTVATPLIDLSSTYLSFSGRLYPGGNTVPAAHLAAGTALARTVVPLDVNGNPSALGRYVLMSLGMSNTTQSWCHHDWDSVCNAWSFTGQAAVDPLVRTSGLAIANGARGSQTAPAWLQANTSNYNRIRDSVLAPRGLSEKQVQVIWIKLANSMPSVSLPSANADAFVLLNQLGAILRTIKVQYPNLKLVFVTSRVYAGYSVTTLSPEPYVYEYGFTLKWLIEEQIRQAANPGSAPDPRTGNLNYSTGVVPWVGWGPYLWTRGTQPRSDGLTWPRTYLEPDGTHPSDLGEEVIGGELLSFFKTAPTTRCWFVVGGTCP